MEIFDLYIDVPSFYLGCISMGVFAAVYLVLLAIWDAFVRWLTERRARVASYGRHSKARKQAPEEAEPCDDPQPTVVMQISRPSLVATRPPFNSSLDSSATVKRDSRGKQ